MRTAKILFALTMVVALCVLWGGQTAGAQDKTGTITGTVLDVKTGKPITYANVIVYSTNLGAMTLGDGRFEIKGVPAGTYTLRALMMGYKSAEKHGVVVKEGEMTEVLFELAETIVLKTQEITVSADRPMVEVTTSACMVAPMAASAGETRSTPQPTCARLSIRVPREPWNTESYDRIYENEFLDVVDNPYSTFSIDVDAASYGNIRRFIRRGQMPPPDAVRIEELVNYFTYDYPEPADTTPFSITAKAAVCPWNGQNKLVHIGLQGRRLTMEDLPPNNLVFLLDVSGSMQPPNKLPLLKKAFRLLAANLRQEDRVAIVVYASAAGLVLPSTAGDQKKMILDAIDRLYAGGSTAGGAGIKLAYKTAEENFLEGGNNRVILATDGDFNTGVSSDAEMTRLIEEKRKSGVFITVLGFGEANLKDSKMEKIADHGNGHYAYIDDIFEARKVLVNELGATLFTIAKDVKIQVEFNPAKVRSYRLIGYENRLLKKEDFDDDQKDAGEIGAGHSVTALYEVVPADKDRTAETAPQSSYMLVSIAPHAFETPEMLTVRFRYKEPNEDQSRLIVQTVAEEGIRFEDATADFRFAAAVAEFGMLLRDSNFKGEASFERVRDTAKKSMGKDEDGYRSEFVRLVEMCVEMAKK